MAYTGKPDYSEHAQFDYRVRQSDYDATEKQLEKLREKNPEISIHISDYFNALLGGEIYPLTIVSDRYGGVYSGASFTAWPLDWLQVPEDIDGCDPECSDFWSSFKGICGKGASPQEAYDDLCKKIIEAIDSIEI